MYQETLRGMRSYMGWSRIPDFDNSSSADDSPFTVPKQHSTGTISVNLPTDEWLCKTLDGLNIKLVEGCPSRTSETDGLQCNQFLKIPRSQSKWNGIHADKDASSSSLSYFYNKSAHLNSPYSQIARSSGLSSAPLASQPIPQETLKK